MRVVLDEVEFATNPDPRCPCVLLLDSSGSMDGAKIDALNEGLRVLKHELMDDELASRRVELAIVSFGHSGVSIDQEFVTAMAFEPPLLMASGATPMGEAIALAFDLLQTRKAAYKLNGIAYYRPWIFMITDGEPTDDWQSAAALVRAEESTNGAAFFAVGVDSADLNILGQIAIRPPIKLKGLAFKELFQWLSASQKRVSASRVGEQVPLPTVDWGTV